MASFFANVHESIADALNVLFPRRCLVCGERLDRTEQHVCTSCYVNLPFTHFHGERGNVVERLFYGRLPIERANALLFYKVDSRSRYLLFALKYYDRPQVGRFFGRIMARDLLNTDFFHGIDFIVPLPLHVAKQRRRGYNQCSALAYGVADLTGLPVREDIVARVVNTPTQTHLTAQERRENMRGAFRLLRPEAVSGRHVLLIDDVLTTNATILSCGEEIAKAAGVRISVLTLALAGQHTTAGHEFSAWWKEPTPTGTIAADEHPNGRESQFEENENSPAKGGTYPTMSGSRPDESGSDAVPSESVAENP